MKEKSIMARLASILFFLTLCIYSFSYIFSSYGLIANLRYLNVILFFASGFFLILEVSEAFRSKK